MRVLVDEGPARVNELIALGAIFDRDAAGELLLAREGGHSHARVVHAGGAATGVEVERALVAAVRSTAAAIYEHWFALDLLVEGGRCAGVVALTPTGERAEVRARHVLVATGGAGQLFAVTTNPPESTGDGIAMALRAGVAVADLEFVQFHPTALHHPVDAPAAAVGGAAGARRPAARRRGRAVRRRAAAPRQGEPGDHRPCGWTRAGTTSGSTPRASTASPAVPDHRRRPRRGRARPGPRLAAGGAGRPLHLRAASSPTSTGRRRCPGLWVAGEAACNGVHGANRLASNSLLDGMVFGPGWWRR